MIAVFVEGVSHVMLAHIVEDELKPFERVVSTYSIEKPYASFIVTRYFYFYSCRG